MRRGWLKRNYHHVQDVRDWASVILSIGIIAFLAGLFVPSLPMQPICGRVNPAEPAFTTVTIIPNSGIFPDTAIVNSTGYWISNFSIGRADIEIHYGTFSYHYNTGVLGTETVNGRKCWWTGTV